MAPTGAPSWGTCQAHGTWRSQSGDLLAGTYYVTVPVRITNAIDDVIVPAGQFATGTLNVTAGDPSLDLALPANDDPDNSPLGWQITVKVVFVGSVATETYVIDTPLGGSVNLREVVLPQTLPPPAPVLLKGEPGGIAELDADGDVLNAAGVKVLPGGGGGGGSTIWSEISGKPSTFPPTIGLTSSTAKAGDYQPSWAQVTGKPATFTPAAHASSHAAAGADPLTVAVSQVSGLVATVEGIVAGSGSVLSVAGKQGDVDLEVGDLTDSTTVGRALMKATDAAAARTAIGAGTGGGSSAWADITGKPTTFAPIVGTTSTTAKAGNYTPTIADLPATSTLAVHWTGSAWPSRPTSRTDITVQWVGGSTAPSGALSGDLWDHTS
ncbi:hypothetical protein [Luteipulveratus mongoliensis]|uniref:hypothetical protein n=1 Tax=Luteipulveratus mongoliensis TaxID=571913 RepID=UPI00069832E4|nr:hypothetical protein [Luteipulveratus mongoliensis]